MELDLEALSRTCSCGQSHQLQLKRIVVAPDALLELRNFLADPLGSGYQNPTIICDSNTFTAAAAFLQEGLPGAFLLCLPAESLHSDEVALGTVMAGLELETDLLLAVGSGTIHDLVRMAAFQRNLPFISVPTAASVDGFVSTVAAISRGGFKETSAAVSPLYVFADTKILAAAPFSLTAAGISDLLGKYTALADWKAAQLLTGEYFCPQVYELEQKALAETLAAIPALQNRQESAYETLMNALLLSGLAMQMIGNSRPASGAEHHLSHLWEMGVLYPEPAAYHGAKVGVGLLASLRLYKELGNRIEKGHKPLREKPDFAERLAGISPSPLKERLSAQTNLLVLKELTPGGWEAVRSSLLTLIEDLPQPEKLEKVMSAAGCPVTLAEIGLPSSILEDSLALAPLVRERFTLLWFSGLF